MKAGCLIAQGAPEGVVASELVEDVFGLPYRVMTDSIRHANGDPGAPAPRGRAGPDVSETGRRVCEVWWARPDAAPEALAAVLDAAERDRLRRFRRPADRARYLAAHAIARMVLAARLGAHPAEITFAFRCGACGGPHGKPRLAGPHPGLEFSLAHSGNRVVVAVADDPVGVDVESLHRGPDVDDLAEEILSLAERAALARGVPAAEAPSALLHHWTYKEAVLKATGQGLAVPPADLTVSPPAEPPRLLAWSGGPPEAAIVQLAAADVGPGYVACVAVLSALPCAVEVREATALIVAAVL